MFPFFSLSVTKKKRVVHNYTSGACWHKPVFMKKPTVNSRVYPVMGIAVPLLHLKLQANLLAIRDKTLLKLNSTLLHMRQQTVSLLQEIRQTNRPQ